MASVGNSYYATFLYLFITDTRTYFTTFFYYFRVLKFGYGLSTSLHESWSALNKKKYKYSFISSGIYKAGNIRRSFKT
jgi:hypothetical protein